MGLRERYRIACERKEAHYLEQIWAHLLAADLYRVRAFEQRKQGLIVSAERSTARRWRHVAIALHIRDKKKAWEGDPNRFIPHNTWMTGDVWQNPNTVDGNGYYDQDYNHTSPDGVVYRIDGTGSLTKEGDVRF